MKHFWWILALVCLTQLTSGLEWQEGPGYRSAVLEPKPTGNRAAGFTLLGSASTGITFSNVLAQARYTTNQILLNGSGVAAGDVDGDGWCDLYFCGLDGPNVLYRNFGNWHFEDITQAAGVACPDLDATGRLARHIAPCPVIASGGVSRLDDIDDLRPTGATAVVIGKAFYEGAFTVEEALARAAGKRTGP